MIFFKRSKIKRISKKIKALKLSRVHNQPSTAALKKEAALYHQLARIYRALEGKKKYPFAHEMVVECYRNSAAIEDSEAQYILAKYLLDTAKFRDALQIEGIFASELNEKLRDECFSESLIFLKMAIDLNHIQAKRLYGLCYINGWGVAVDQDKGFEFVVSSIEQEGSWDKVTQIFTAIGLNKPEFYTAMMKHRTK